MLLAHPALRAPGEGYVGPQRVELAGEVNPIEGQPWQPGQKVEVSPDGSTIYTSPYGRAWAVQAPDAAGVQAKLVDLISHEVQHPAQAFGQPAARNTLVPASPEHAAATGDQWVTSEIPGEAPVPGHATTGTWYDDRLADLIKVMRVKGTDKYSFLTDNVTRGYYEYVNKGNSYVQSNINGAMGATR